MTILAYLTGFVIGAGWVLVIMGLRERRLRREHDAEIARLSLTAPVSPHQSSTPADADQGGA